MRIRAGIEARGEHDPEKLQTFRIRLCATSKRSPRESPDQQHEGSHHGSHHIADHRACCRHVAAAGPERRCNRDSCAHAGRRASRRQARGRPLHQAGRDGGGDHVGAALRRPPEDRGRRAVRRRGSGQARDGGYREGRIVARRQPCRIGARRHRCGGARRRSRRSHSSSSWRATAPAKLGHPPASKCCRRDSGNPANSFTTPSTAAWCRRTARRPISGAGSAAGGDNNR